MENNKVKLYLGVDGKYYKESELETAYFLCTGRHTYSEDKPGDSMKMFNCWVYDLLGHSITKIVNRADVPYVDFLTRGQKLLAVVAYRERNNCTLREAKAHIEEIENNLKKEGIIV